MKSLLSVAVLVAALGVAGPAVAQPLEIVVPGGSYFPSDDDGPSFNNNPDIYRAPIDPAGRFDPGQAAINALHHSHFWLRGSSFNLDRAVTLNATGDSILEHQLKCQAAYASYDMASDTYLGSNGIPRPCRL
jgi:hypothetical protein